MSYGGLLYRPMKKKVKGEGWLTGLSRYMNDKEIVIKWNLTPLLGPVTNASPGERSP